VRPNGVSSSGNGISGEDLLLLEAVDQEEEMPATGYGSSGAPPGDVLQLAGEEGTAGTTGSADCVKGRDRRPASYGSSSSDPIPGLVPASAAVVPSPQPLGDGKPRYRQVIRKIWKPMLSVSLTFLGTLVVFPGVIAHIPSRRWGDWMPVVLISVFNFFDFVGKILPEYDAALCKCVRLTWLLQIICLISILPSLTSN